MTEANENEGRAQSQEKDGAGRKPFPDFIVAPPGTQSGTQTGTQPGAPVESAGGLGKPAPLPASPMPRPQVVRKGGTGWSALFALIALVGAGATIAAPSLRPLLADQLRAQFGEHEWIATVTGTETPRPSRLEIDLVRFDERVAQLKSAIDRLPTDQPIDRDTLVRFLTSFGPDEHIQALGARIETNEQGIAAFEKALAANGAMIAAVETRVGDGEQAARDLASRVDTTEARLGALESAASALPTLAEDVARLTAQTAEFGTKAAEDSAATRETLSQAVARLDGVDMRISLADTRIGEIEDLTKNAGERFGALRDVVAPLPGRLDAAASATQALDARIATTESVIAGLGALPPRVATLETRADKTETTIARLPSNNGIVLLAIAARIRTAIEDGVPFVAEIAAASRYGGGNRDITPALADLAKLANGGAPSLSVLRRDFNLSLAKKALEAEEANALPWYQSTIMSLQAMLGWGVEPPPSRREAVRATLARAAALINNGQLEAAVAEIRSLPMPAALHGEAWVREATIRVNADNALRDLTNGALKALTPSGG